MSILGIEIIIYILNGLLGAILRELLEGNKQRNRECLIRILVIGAISGYIYYYLHTDYNLPNNIMSIVFGYFSYDLLPRVFRTMKEVINNRKQL